ncbi:MAG: peptidase [Roseateles depolymerans]|uniref:Peptidase n=1 Tax=Roseateles depolymerans TaxID=76731 RepID=A0A2W5G3G9_9BURK|nr:MAG: peptidase [Roseateles depolymerans]
MKNKQAFKLLACTAALSAGLMGAAHADVQIIINNINAAGVGFNDTTPAAPVGGNTGTTLGEQRLIAFTYAANLWGKALTSTQPIIINAQFSALACTSTSATLGSAGATSIFRNFANAPLTNTWYSYALANKISGSYLGTANAAQINANFNVNLGNTGCLDGQPFYLGLDGNHGASAVDFVAVLQHEMGHGLGFQTFTNGQTGAQNGTSPSVWDHFLMGTATGKLWKDMTAAERAASAISVDKLVWTGPNVTALAPQVLRVGLPKATITGSAAGDAAGAYTTGEASFGPSVAAMPKTGVLMPMVPTSTADTSAVGLSLGCDALTGNNARAAVGNIVLISRGSCNFAVKAKNAQNAGAIGVLIVNNAAGVAGMSGTDATLVIPTLMIDQTVGATLLTKLATRSRTSSGVIATMGLSGTQMAGADAQGRLMMYAPNPYVSGSSVSHFDVSATRNLLMEPAINGDLTQVVIPPYDLTLPLLRDIGW